MAVSKLAGEEWGEGREGGGGGHNPEPWGIQIFRGWEEGKKLKEETEKVQNWRGDLEGEAFKKQSEVSSIKYRQCDEVWEVTLGLATDYSLGHWIRIFSRASGSRSQDTEGQRDTQALCMHQEVNPVGLLPMFSRNLKNGKHRGPRIIPKFH